LETEAFRIVALRDSPRGKVLEPVDDVLYESWRAACKAIRERGSREPLATQSCLVDAEGRIVWPIETVTTRGRWHLAPNASYGHRMHAVKEKETPPPVVVGEKRPRSPSKPIGFEEKTRQRIAKIRKQDPGFGRRQTNDE
jgi:hypothetical protein